MKYLSAIKRAALRMLVDEYACDMWIISDDGRSCPAGTIIVSAWRLTTDINQVAKEMEGKFIDSGFSLDGFNSCAIMNVRKI
ncbi:MAG: hypothetical protein ACRCXB_30115 [Aeromonadaceae bacterium]